jgi:hypothetical protein
MRRRRYHRSRWLSGGGERRRLLRQLSIPIYSAVDHMHDYVVQARGAFDETVLGILKLKDRAHRVDGPLKLNSVVGVVA